MKIKNKIRQRASQALDTLIPENRWEEYLDLLDREGKFSRKNMLSMIMIVCQSIETLENLMEDLYFERDIESKRPAESFKLRNSLDVKNDLDKNFHPNTSAWYVNTMDWKILEKSASNDSADYGFGKENDPLDGKQKTCLYYRDLPVFKK